MSMLHSIEESVAKVEKPKPIDHEEEAIGRLQTLLMSVQEEKAKIELMHREAVLIIKQREDRIAKLDAWIGELEKAAEPNEVAA